MTDFARTTIDDVDLAKYDKLGDEWWDPKGPMGALHKFNPVRVAWITGLLTREVARPAGAANTSDRPLAGFRVLDVGCGGGILSESLARLGAEMVGVDPAPNNIAASARHAEKSRLPIDYRCTTVETLAKAGERFDAVLVMEVVEHVKDVPGFLRDAASMVKSGGLMIGATINRTLKGYALVIVGAEYVLRWLPRGTHNWNQFVTPAEFMAAMTRNGLVALDEAGVTYNLLRDRWSLSKDMGCNYMVASQRPAG